MIIGWLSTQFVCFMTSDQFIGLPWQSKNLENDFFLNDTSSKTTIKAVLQTSLLLMKILNKTKSHVF